jgi:hypothetical protein
MGGSGGSADSGESHDSTLDKHDGNWGKMLAGGMSVQKHEEEVQQRQDVGCLYIRCAACLTDHRRRAGRCARHCTAQPDTPDREKEAHPVEILP